MEYTSPRTWVASETVTAALLNTHLRDQLLHIAGTSGFTGTPTAGRGIEPASGYFMGAAGAIDHHVESATQTTSSVVDTTITEHTYTFANAYASAPRVTVSQHVNASTTSKQLDCSVCIKTGYPTTTQVIVLHRNGSGETVNVTTEMIAEGVD